MIFVFENCVQILKLDYLKKELMCDFELFIENWVFFSN